jgi:hypothetical protein
VCFCCSRYVCDYFFQNVYRFSSIFVECSDTFTNDIVKEFFYKIECIVELYLLLQLLDMMQKGTEVRGAARNFPEWWYSTLIVGQTATPT